MPFERPVPGVRRLFNCQTFAVVDEILWWEKCFFSQRHNRLGREIRVLPIRSRTYGLPVTSLARVDNAIQWTNLYPANSEIGFPNTYPIQRLNNWPRCCSTELQKNRGSEGHCGVTNQMKPFWQNFSMVPVIS